MPSGVALSNRPRCRHLTPVTYVTPVWQEVEKDDPQLPSPCARRMAPIALLIAAGCKQGPSPEVQARIDSLSQASSQRDGLMQEVAENTAS